MRVKFKVSHLLLAAALVACSGSAKADNAAEVIPNPPKDIMNTLIQSGKFHTFVDGLEHAYQLDHTLKNRGPFTVFAPDDRAFAKIPQADRDSLWRNKKQLDKVLRYHIVNGKLSCDAIEKMSALKTNEGNDVAVSSKNGTTGDGGIFLDKAKVTKGDIVCSNGVIHVLDSVIMPQLSK